MENRNIVNSNKNPIVGIIFVILIVGALIIGLNINTVKKYINKDKQIEENNNKDDDNNNESVIKEDENSNNDNSNDDNKINENENNNDDNKINKEDNSDDDTNKKNEDINENNDEEKEDIPKTCKYDKKVLTYIGQNNKKIAECEGASYKSMDDSIVSISRDGVITPKKIGTTSIKITNGNNVDDIIVYVDHQRIESGNNTLVLYNVDKASSLSTDYDVFVKLPDETSYHKIQVYKVQVSILDKNEKWNSSYSSYVNFDFKGTVNVKVVPKDNFTSFRLRGNIYSQNSQKKGNEILFNLTNYGVISLETKNGSNYDTRTNLHIFANTLDNNFKNINLNDPNTIYISPGEHKCANNNCVIPEDKNILKEKRKSTTSSNSYPAAIELKSNSTIYISGSAILHSQLTIDKWNDSSKKGTKLSNIKIFGRGALDTSDLITTNISSDEIKFTDSNVTSGLIRIVYSKSVTIDGIILKNSKSYNVYIKDSDNINISNLKIISAGKYTDGIHVLSSRSINANNVFIRTCDDGVAIYSSRGSGGYKSGSFVGLNGNSTNMNFNNMLLWIDNGRSIYIGGHGNFNSTLGQGNEICKIKFNKMRILETNKRIDHEGALSIGAADNNHVYDITFDNITVDNLINGNLISVKNYCSNYPIVTYENTIGTKCGYMVDNITFNDINWNGRFNDKSNTKVWINIEGKKEDNTVKCNGESANYLIKNINFNNVTLGSIKLSNDNKNNLYENINIFKTNDCVSDCKIN